VSHFEYAGVFAHLVFLTLFEAILQILFIFVYLYVIWASSAFFTACIFGF